MRQCGGCTLCCKLIPVEELGKAAGHRCEHQRSGKGCAIYPRRPWSCREWTCMWIKGTEDGRELQLRRPDRSHYVIDEVPDIVRVTDNVTGEVTQLDVMQIWCDPKFPHAWDDPELLAMLDRQGVIGLVRFDSEKGFAIFPPSRSSTGKWERGVADSAEDLRGAQRAARFEFWRRQVEEHSLEKRSTTPLQGRERTQLEGPPDRAGMAGEGGRSAGGIPDRRGPDAGVAAGDGADGFRPAARRAV